MENLESPLVFRPYFSQSDNHLIIEEGPERGLLLSMACQLPANSLPMACQSCQRPANGAWQGSRKTGSPRRHAKPGFADGHG
jgi:hypothetical protein